MARVGDDLVRDPADPPHRETADRRGPARRTSPAPACGEGSRPPPPDRRSPAAARAEWRASRRGEAARRSRIPRDRETRSSRSKTAVLTLSLRHGRRRHSEWRGAAGRARGRGAAGRANGARRRGKRAQRSIEAPLRSELPPPRFPQSAVSVGRTRSSASSAAPRPRPARRRERRIAVRHRSLDR